VTGIASQPPRDYRPEKLPFWMRFEWGNDAATVNLICSCNPKAEPQSMMVRPEVKDSSVEFHCRYCGRGFQFRAFRKIGE
jgi:hypothetical protein